MSANLIIPVGVPGSGKSTWARTVLRDKYSIVSSDEIRKQIWGSLRAAHDVTPEVKKERNRQVWEKFDSAISERLKHRVDVYADGTNLTTRRRKILVSLAETYGADIHVFIFDNAAEACERNVKRDPDIVVPDDVQVEFLKMFADSYHAILDDERDKYNTVTIIGSLQ